MILSYTNPQNATSCYCCLVPLHVSNGGGYAVLLFPLCVCVCACVHTCLLVYLWTCMCMGDSVWVYVTLFLEGDIELVIKCYP